MKNSFILQARAALATAAAAAAQQDTRRQPMSGWDNGIIIQKLSACRTVDVQCISQAAHWLQLKLAQLVQLTAGTLLIIAAFDGLYFHIYSICQAAQKPFVQQFPSRPGIRTLLDASRMPYSTQ